MSLVFLHIQDVEVCKFADAAYISFWFRYNMIIFVFQSEKEVDLAGDLQNVQYPEVMQKDQDGGLCKAQVCMIKVNLLEFK